MKDMRMPRPTRLLLAALCVALGSDLHAINLSLTSPVSPPTPPQLTQDVPAGNLPTVPGADIATTSYTLASTAVLRVRKNPGGWMTGSTGWYISAHKVDTTWHPNLALNIRCSAPTTGWNFRLSTFTALSGSDLLLVRRASRTQLAGITFQFQITGVTAVVGTTNTTLVVYTLTEY